jgi:hypothetical protein
MEDNSYYCSDADPTSCGAFPLLGHLKHPFTSKTITRNYHRQQIRNGRGIEQKSCVLIIRYALRNYLTSLSLVIYFNKGVFPKL